MSSLPPETSAVRPACAPETKVSSQRPSSASTGQRSSGTAWLQHLDSTAQRKHFENGNGSILATAPYLPADSQIDVDFDGLLSLCEDWLSIQPVNPHVKGKAR